MAGSIGLKMKMKEKFTAKNSAAIKGIAILMMLWHHCFLSGRFEKYLIIFSPLMESQVINIASFCKICVSLFAFVSGYGLYLSFAKNLSRGRDWIQSRLVRLLSGYWFIVLLSWFISLVIDGRTYTFYFDEKNIWLGVWTMFIEFFGLSNFFGLSPFNGSWWYISAAMVFVLLVPLLYKSLTSIGIFNTLALSIIVPRVMGGYFGGTHWMSFLFAFLLGMVVAKSAFFERWTNWNISKYMKFLLLFFACVFGYKLYYHLPTNLYWEVKYGLIPFLIILFAKEYIIPLPIIGAILEFLGKHSANIWLIHTFIRYHYCEAFIYGMEHFIIVILALLLISLALSIIVEFLKRIIGYEKLINKLLQWKF